MDTNKVKTFMEVAKRKSFNAAAENLFLSPATVSKHILSLEEELHVKLFERSFNGVELTESGERFWQYAAASMASYVKMMEEFSGMTPKGIVRLGVPSCQYFFDIPDLLERFKNAWPQIPYETIETRVSMMGEMLQRGKYHIAFFIDAALDKNQMDYVPLRKEKLAVAVNKEHTLAQADEVSVTDLCGYDLISFPEEKRRYRLLADVFQQSGVELNLKLTTLRDENILEFVSLNKGVGIVSSYGLSHGGLEHYGKGRVKLLRIKEDTSWDFAMVKAKGISLPPNAEKFWKFTQNCVKKGIWPPAATVI